jgi:hypothetical protein
MKHSLLKILSYTLLLVLVNSIQGCAGNNIGLKKSTSTAPKEVIPENNLTPNNKDKESIPNPQEGNKHTNSIVQRAQKNSSHFPATLVNNLTPNNEDKGSIPNPQESNNHANSIVQQAKKNSSHFPATLVNNLIPNTKNEKKIVILDLQESTEHANNTVRQTPGNLSDFVATPEIFDNSANNPTPNSETQTATSDAQERNGRANPTNTAQQQKLSDLINKLPAQFLTNINNQLQQGQPMRSIKSLEHAMDMLKVDALNNSQLKIFEEAVNKGAKKYLKDFDVTNTSEFPHRSKNIYIKQVEVSKQLEDIKKCIEQQKRKNDLQCITTLGVRSE